MSDYFFKKFYDDVRTDHWPLVANYNDFLKLPKHIIDECYQLHNLQIRKDQIESQKYWIARSNLAIGYKSNDLIYVPVFKCASTYYTQFFHESLGWEKINLWQQDWSQVSAFGIIMHPITRVLKGLTQTMGMSYNYNYEKILVQLQDPDYLNFVRSISICDPHSMPLRFSYGELFEKIHWMPMELGVDRIKDLMTEIALNHGIVLDIPRGDKQGNQSSDVKTKIFEIIRNNWLASEPTGDFYALFADDLKSYHKIVENYHEG